MRYPPSEKDEMSFALHPPQPLISRRAAGAVDTVQRESLRARAPGCCHDSGKLHFTPVVGESGNSRAVRQTAAAAQAPPGAYPRCGEERLVDEVVTGPSSYRFCGVCSYDWVGAV